ncbi:MAG: hypothetical protein HYT79_08200 [Elusimicrobia bacterium]|nr:hypothetical protein [Elusimicrobiota bacterium]
MRPWTKIRGWFKLALCAAGFLLPGCGTISTYQTGKTVPKGKFSFGMGTAAGLFRTKSHMVGFPLELGYGMAEVFAGYGLFDFLDFQVKMAAATPMKADNESDDLAKFLKGGKASGGGSVRLAMAQERWGFPLSVAVGSGYYVGSMTESRTDFKTNAETFRRWTEIRDQVFFVNVSKDVFSWLTPYGAYKLYRRLTFNRTWVYGVPTAAEAINDTLQGYGAGVSFNVGRHKNTHIMLEANAIKDTDEPARHYQKQAGLGMSVEF